jgi:hypothetical protein
MIEKCGEGVVFLFRRRIERGRDWSIDEQKPGCRGTSNHVPSIGHF